MQMFVKIIYQMFVFIFLFVTFVYVKKYKNMSKNRLKHLSAKSLCDSTKVNYRNVADSFKHKNKLSMSVTDRKKIISEVEKTLSDLIKIYEL